MNGCAWFQKNVEMRTKICDTYKIKLGKSIKDPETTQEYEPHVR